MKKLLLPIRPKYVNQILAGTKKVEYRTKIRKDALVNQILIYQSCDVRKVVGEFRISGIIQGTPDQVWNATKNVGGISEESFFKYFKNKETAYAYQISDLIFYDKPISLEDLGLHKAPMSYQYVDVD